MSITVVSTPLTPTPPTATDSGSDSGLSAAAQDFANLLQGQLSSNATLPTAAIEGQSDLPITSAPPADAAALLAALGLASTLTDAKPDAPQAADTALGDATSSDAPADAAASVLAALGLATTPAVSAQQDIVKIDQKTGEPLTGVLGSAGQNLKADGQSELLQISPALAATAVNDDQAAKFAAALATAEQAVGTKTDSPDVTADGISSPSSNVLGNAASHPIQRDSSLAVHTPVRDQNWASDFSQKIVWLANNDKQSAQLTLNPPQMGPIEISLNVDKGNASVSFASANAEVRDAIETALPRLREMFASAGIELGQTNVGAQSFSQQQAGNGEKNQSSSRWMNDNAILATETTGALQTGAFAARQGNGMVDIFA